MHTSRVCGEGRQDPVANLKRRLEIAARRPDIKIKFKADGGKADKDFLICEVRDNGYYGHHIFSYNGNLSSGYIDENSSCLVHAVNYIKTKKFWDSLKKSYPKLKFTFSERDLVKDPAEYVHMTNGTEFKKRGYLICYCYDVDDPDKSFWKIGYLDFFTGELNCKKYPGDTSESIQALFEQRRTERLEQFNSAMNVKYNLKFLGLQQSRMSAEKHLREHHLPFVIYYHQDLDADAKVYVSFVDPYDNIHQAEFVLCAKPFFEDQLNALIKQNDYLADVKSRFPDFKLKMLMSAPIVYESGQGYLYYDPTQNCLVFSCLDEAGDVFRYNCTKQFKALKNDRYPVLFSGENLQCLEDVIVRFFSFSQELPLINILRKTAGFSTIVSANLKGPNYSIFVKEDQFTIKWDNTTGNYTIKEKAYGTQININSRPHQDMAESILNTYCQINDDFSRWIRNTYRLEHVYASEPLLKVDQAVVVINLPQIEVHWLNINGVPVSRSPKNLKELETLLKKLSQYHKIKTAIQECRTTFVGLTCIEGTGESKKLHVNIFENNESYAMMVGYYDFYYKRVQARTCEPENLREILLEGAAQQRDSEEMLAEVNQYRFSDKFTKTAGNYNFDSKTLKLEYRPQPKNDVSPYSDFLAYCVDRYKVENILSTLSIGLLMVAASNPDAAFREILSFGQDVGREGLAMPNLGATATQEKKRSADTSYCINLYKKNLCVAKMISTVKDQINERLAVNPADLVPHLLPIAIEENTGSETNQKRHAWYEKGFVLENNKRIEITRKGVVHLLMGHGFLAKKI